MTLVVDTRQEQTLPGGGFATTEIFIASPTPIVEDVRPRQLLVGEPSTTTVFAYGVHITAESVILWDGEPRPTERDRPNRLFTIISPADQARADTIAVQIRTPGSFADSEPWFVPILPG